MFDNLATRLQNVFTKLRGRGRLSEQDVGEALREVRLALLEADVNFKVVKDFIAEVKERAVGEEVLKSLTPGQQVIKIVHEELAALMGSGQSKLAFASKPPTIIMLVGLQGSGKTTATAKLAHYLKNQGKRPFLVAADIYRPAAIEQLKILGEEIGVPVFSKVGKSVLALAKQGIREAVPKNCDVVVVDTAGRLHIDEKMMNELEEVKREVRPHQVLLVVDAMTGQDAVNVALVFKERVDFDGVILTKLDGDARGGAALSIKAVTGRPIKLASVGEKLDDLQPFHPDRMSSRILGMGDALTLIEKAKTAIEADKAQALEEKIRKDSFDLEDFLEQLRQFRRVGPASQIMEMLPRIPGLPNVGKLQVDEGQLGRLEVIIQSMTPEERRDPTIINGGRRSRIARGSGTTSHEVNQLLKQFEQARKLMKQLGKLSRPKPGRRPFPFIV
ncbi:MAG: signal recognition particle protein [Actinomycetota bacterium]|nr:signal recognition particle protein [Actinomycetota bacterium]